MTIKFSDSIRPDCDYLLIGNSRLHWAIKKDNSYEFFHTLFDQRFPENVNLKKLVWASVGKYPTIKLSNNNEINISNLTFKKMPDHIGIDRALACFAAYKIIENEFKKNILIVDLGTTVSITKIDNKGNLIGGQLLPGFTTQLKSMDENTKNLTFPKNTFIPSNNFQTATFKAMLRGVYNSIFGAIKLSFNPKQDVLIICGGDAKFLGETIRKEIKNIIIEPNLVMYGMIFSKTQANII